MTVTGGKRKIHVVTDRADALTAHYLIAKLGWHWTRMGHKFTAGPVDQVGPDVDLAILHMDRTRIDSQSIPPNPSGRPLLNSAVLDISKRSFSSNRVSQDDPWDGEVIIKSNLNCFGLPEWNHGSPGFFLRGRRRLARKHWQLARMLPPGAYPVLPRITAVPGWVWNDPEVIVERFIPEREDGLYCLRGWVFFGTRSYTYRMFSSEKIVKVASIVRHEFLGEPPPELVAFRQARNWDFGKFDYVEVDGRPILLDINKTPTTAGSSGPDTPRLRHLAAGLEEFLGGT